MLGRNTALKIPLGAGELYDLRMSGRRPAQAVYLVDSRIAKQWLQRWADRFTIALAPMGDEAWDLDCLFDLDVVVLHAGPLGTLEQRLRGVGVASLVVMPVDSWVTATRLILAERRARS